MKNFINKFLSLIKKHSVVLFSTILTFTAFITPRVAFAISNIDTAATFVIVAVPFLTEWIWWILASKVAAPILNLVITELVTGSGFSITRDAVVLTLWSISKNWANMFIVVGLITVAVATILNLEKYRAQKLLVPLIIVALLVNFSVVFVGLVVDLSNILMNSFFGPGVGGPASIVREVDNLEKVHVKDYFEKFLEKKLRPNTYVNLFFTHNGLGPNREGNGIIGIIIRILELAAIYFVLAFAFIYLAIILLVRYVMLVILFIVSPLAFVFMVFPFDLCRTVWKGWIDKFIRWCFIGVGAGFVLRLATEMFSALSRYPISEGHIREAELRVFIVGAILVVGLYLTTKSAGKIAGAVIGLATGAAMLTGGLALKGMAKSGQLLGAGAGAAGGGAGGGAMAFAKGIFAPKKEGTWAAVKDVWKGMGAGARGGAKYGGGAGGVVSGMVKGGVGGYKKGGIGGILKGAGGGAMEEGSSGAKLGAGLAGGVVGAGKAMAGGGVKEIGKGAREGVAGAKESYDKMMNTKDKALEKLGATPEKSAEKSSRERGQERMKPYEALAESESDNAKVADKATNSNTAAERAAYAKVLIKRKKFDMVDADKREEVAENAVAHGVEKSAFTDTHPELLAVTDEEARQQLISKEKAKNEAALIPSMGRKKAAKEAEKVTALYKPTELDIKTEKEKMRTEKIKQRTLGYGAVSDKEASDKVVSDAVDSELDTKITRLDPVTGATHDTTKRKDLENSYVADGLTPEEIEIRMQEEVAEMKKQYKRTSPPSTDEILKAKQDLTAERGTPETAAKNETEIKKLMATNKGMTREQASARLLKNAHAASKINTSDASDEEVLKKAEEETSEGAKFLKEAITRGILHLVSAGSREKAVKNATRLGDRVEALAKEDYHYEEYDDKAVNKVLIKAEETARRAAGITAPMTEAEKKTHTDSVLATDPRRTAAKKVAVKARLKENLPRMSDDQLRNISPVEHLTSDIVSEFSVKQIQAFESEPATSAYLKNLITTATPPDRSLNDLLAEVAPGGSYENDTEFKRLRKTIRAIEALP